MEDALTVFINEERRREEEKFVRDFSSCHSLNLYFTDGDSLTDGRSIFIDPSFGNIYKNEALLKEVEKNYSSSSFLSSSSLHSLSFITRALEYHECLHIAYTFFEKTDDFFVRNRTYDNNKDALLYALINLNEDIFIENKGRKENKEIDLYLGVLNDLYYLNDKENDYSLNEVNLILSMMMKKYIYHKDYLSSLPLVNTFFEEKIVPCIDASLSSEAEERLMNAGKIFNYLSEGYTYRVDKFKLTSSPFKNYKRTRIYHPDCLYIHKDNISLKKGDFLSEEKIIDKFNERVKAVEREYDLSSLKEICFYEEKEIITSYLPFKSRLIRNNIVPSDFNKYMAYKEETLLLSLRLSRLISSYMKFDKYQKEEKRSYGSYIDSHRLADSKKKYWVRNNYYDSYDDIVFLILLDESASMRKKKEILKSIIMLHEAFYKSKIKHMIYGYSAPLGKDEVLHSLLWKEDYSYSESYYIMGYEPGHDTLMKKETLPGERKKGYGTREGASLLWAKEKLSDSKFAAYKKCIILISDGESDHYGEKDNRAYRGGLALEDIRNALNELSVIKAEVCAVAYDVNNEGIYDTLKGVYKDVISVSSPEALEKNFLRLINLKMKR